MSLLGLDIGSTNAKGGVFALDGRLIKSASREYPMAHPRPGWAELDSLEMIQCALSLVRELGASAKAAGDPIQAMGISSLGESLTPVSADGRILANAIHHSDVRGGIELEGILNQISPERLYGLNANVAMLGSSAVKLLWWKRNRPDIALRAHRYLFFGDLLLQRLGIEPVTSYSLASRTLLFDLKKECWCDELLQIVDLEEGRLPRLAASDSIAGVIPDRIASELGLPQGVQCAVGGHDQCCNALGIGAGQEGKAADGIGTVECITPVFAGIPNMSRMRSTGLHIEHHVIPGLYVSFIYNQAGSLVKWFRNTFAQLEGDPNRKVDYDALTAEMPAAPTNLLVLPHFEPTGAPHNISDSSGAIIGLRTNTRRGEILKAIMESETFYFRDAMESLRGLSIDVRSYLASGGGAKSAEWLQIKADIMGVLVEQSPNTEGGVAGAAMLAGKASGQFNTFEDLTTCFCRPGRVFEPDHTKAACYAEKFDQYRRIPDSLGKLPRCSTG